jgi:hypothetical protein
MSGLMAPPYQELDWKHLFGILLLEKLIFAQLVKTFAVFYASRKLVTVFTTACHWIPVVRNSVQIVTPYFFKIPFNIIPLFKIGFFRVLRTAVSTPDI